MRVRANPCHCLALDIRPSASHCQRIGARVHCLPSVALRRACVRLAPMPAIAVALALALCRAYAVPLPMPCAVPRRAYPDAVRVALLRIARCANVPARCLIAMAQ